MDVPGKIKELAESVLQEQSALNEQSDLPEQGVLQGKSGLFIVEVLYNPKQRPARLMIILDGDNGVTIDQCAILSRKLSVLIDEQNVLEDAYLLEVSTPGLDHPLKLKRQYFKNKGRQFKVHLKDKTIVQGKLEDVSEEKLTITQVVDKKQTKVIEVTFDQIERAFVMVSFKHN
jgi:ribosome maturation factor RimP